MILYLDSSAFVKIYIDEPESLDVIGAVTATGVTTTTHEIAHIEIRSAMASAMRRNTISVVSWDTAKLRFLSDWQSTVVVRTTDELLHRAGELAEGFALRAYDSLHLATVEFLNLQSEGEIQFGCFDKRLSEAARLLGIPLRF